MPTSIPRMNEKMIGMKKERGIGDRSEEDCKGLGGG